MRYPRIFPENILGEFPIRTRENARFRETPVKTREYGKGFEMLAIGGRITA